MSPSNKVITCPECGGEFGNIGLHWNGSSDCDYPKLTAKQRETVVGLLMGDGCLVGHNIKDEKCHMDIDMTTKPYLEYLDDMFGPLGKGVRRGRSAEQSAKENRESGFHPDANADDYHDMYRWRTCNHPELSKFASWYSSGSKAWSSSIDLTPTVLKHLFVGDGTKDPTNYIKIYVSKERKNKDKVEEMFSRAGLSTPEGWNPYTRKDGSIGCLIWWTVEQSKELWNYMGPPLPGFEYKWPQNY